MEFKESYFQEKNNRSIFETVEALNGLAPKDIFEVVDFDHLTESEIQERFATPCFARRNSLQLTESNNGPAVEDNLRSGAEAGGDLVPDEASDGTTRFKIGNAKVKAVVFSMTPAYECPADKLGYCKSSEACYAKRDEHVYPDVGSARAKQKIYWENVTAEQFVEDFMEVVMPKYRSLYGKPTKRNPAPIDYKAKMLGGRYEDLTSGAKKAYDKKLLDLMAKTGKTREELTGRDVNVLRAYRSPVSFLRFNESGDFRNASDIAKVSKIADMLGERLGIRVYTYTARKDLDFSGATFNIKGSGYPNLTKNGHCVVFPEADDVPEGYKGCPAVEQGITCLLGCRLCATTDANIAFRQHSNLGAIVDKIVCDRYKEVYDPESVVEGSIVIVKKIDGGDVPKMQVYTKDRKWKQVLGKTGKLAGVAIVHGKRVPKPKLGDDQTADVSSDSEYADANVLTDIRGEKFFKPKKEFIKDTNAMMFVTADDAQDYIDEFLTGSDAQPFDLSGYVKQSDTEKRELAIKTKLEPAYAKITPSSVGVRDYPTESVNPLVAGANYFLD